MREARVEVFGPEPPCVRCQSAKKTVEKVADKLEKEGIRVSVERINIVSRDAVSKYGVLVSPAIAVNGVVRTVGRVPSEQEVEKLIRQAIQ